MKRIMSLALLCAFGAVSLVSAEKMDREHLEKIANVARELEGKEVEISAALHEKWHEYYSMELRKHARIMNRMARTLPLALRTRYTLTASALSAAADALDATPAVSFKKRLHPIAMLLQEAKHLELKGETFEEIGKQLNLPNVLEMGEMKEKFGKALKAKLVRSACARAESMQGDGMMEHKMEMMEMEGQDEWQDDEGCDQDEDEGGETVSAPQEENEDENEEDTDEDNQ